MKKLLTEYVSELNQNDNEYYRQNVPNANAADWMWENIPLIDIPDKAIEKIYYFRWWVFRKHIKSTEDGYVITEFLPPVPWGGKHNTIIAAAGHHIAEAKWLKCSKKLIEDYALLYLEEKTKTYLYSSWLIDAIYEYCSHTGDFSFGIQHLDQLMHYYETVEKEHLTSNGLFWSIDDSDAMEYSISGMSEDLTRMKGIRPTLNSYMAANARAIANFAKLANRTDLATVYEQKYKSIKHKMNEILWDGGFYKAIHTENLNFPSLGEVPTSQNVKELIGFIPWCFDLAPSGREEAFAELKASDGFSSPYGLTTAEQRHPRYLYENEHDCLWNGYIWPFATSQVLRAMENLLDHYEQSVVTDADFYDILHTYAKSHTRSTEDSKEVCWIDEVKHPKTNDWSSRTILKGLGWRKEKGGLERGKDYNHSTFCDIVLGGLLGIRVKGGQITVNPHVPDDWEAFTVDNLWINGKCHKITYRKDTNGRHVNVTQK